MESCVPPPLLLPPKTICCLIPPPYSCISINLTRDSIQQKLPDDKRPAVLTQLSHVFLTRCESCTFLSFAEVLQHCTEMSATRVTQRLLQPRRRAGAGALPTPLAATAAPPVKPAGGKRKKFAPRGHRALRQRPKGPASRLSHGGRSPDSRGGGGPAARTALRRPGGFSSRAGPETPPPTGSGRHRPNGR